MQVAVTPRCPGPLTPTAPAPATASATASATVDPEFFAKLDSGAKYLATAIKGTASVNASMMDGPAGDSHGVEAARYFLMHGRNDIIDAVDHLSAGVSSDNVTTLNKALDLLDTITADGAHGDPRPSQQQIIDIATPALHMVSIVRDFASRPAGDGISRPRGVSAT
ncbi:MAG: hypothetical protein JWM25_549 [Thermoleophilia bacterium]|nr:hypothetical protein [Thermoleophilia bacterium]